MMMVMVMVMVMMTMTTTTTTNFVDNSLLDSMEVVDLKIRCSWCFFSRTFFDILFCVSFLFSAGMSYTDTGYNYKFFETFHLHRCAD